MVYSFSKSFFIAQTGLTCETLVIEALPLEIQRNFTLIRELDSDAQGTRFVLIRSIYAHN